MREFALANKSKILTTHSLRGKSATASQRPPFRVVDACIDAGAFFCQISPNVDGIKDAGGASRFHGHCWTDSVPELNKVRRSRRSIRPISVQRECTVPLATAVLAWWFLYPVFDVNIHDLESARVERRAWMRARV